MMHGQRNVKLFYMQFYMVCFHDETKIITNTITMITIIVISAWKTYQIRVHAQYSLPDDEHKMFETCITEVKH